MDVSNSRGGSLVVLVGIFFVIGTSLASVAGVVGAASALSDTLYVDDGTAPSDPFCAPGGNSSTVRYQNVQTAVLDASPGDTIRVCDGTYGTPIVVNKPLTIDGSGGVIDLGEGPGTVAIFLEVGASGTVIEGLTIRNASTGVFARTPNITVADTSFKGIEGSAVELRNADGATVREVNVADASLGVSVELSSDVTIDSGTFVNLEGAAVDLQEADGATVEGVDITDASSGVSVRSSSDVRVADSMIEGVGGVAVDLQNTGDATLSGVDVRNGSTGVAVTADEGEVVTSVTVRDSTIRDLNEGVRVDATDDAQLSGLALSGFNISRTAYGIRILVSGDGSNLTDVTVTGSTVLDSPERGVEVSTIDAAQVRDVLLSDLTVNGSGTGESEGVTIAARDGGTTRNVMLQDLSVSSHAIGLALQTEERAVLRNVTAFRNRIIGSERGVLVDGMGSFEAVGVHENLVANSSNVGVLVTSGTDPRSVEVTRNVLRDNAFGIRNEGDDFLTAWLNHWGADSGPSTQHGITDPVTLTPASGDGDGVSRDVRFDPWLGKGACSGESFDGVADGAVDLYGVSIDRSELQSVCVWDLAPLSLRPDPADAATSAENLNLFYDLPGTDGPAPADRPNVSIYEAGEAFDLRFGAGSIDTSAFAGDDTQLIVVYDPVSTTSSFDVGFDELNGETVLRNDAASMSVYEEWGTLDGNGYLSEPFTPAAPGSYTFVLVRSDFGTGVEERPGASEARIDGGATVLGYETAVVQAREADATEMNASDEGYPAGSVVRFDLSSNLGGATDHAVLLYDESRFRNTTVTVRVDATAADVFAGTFDPAGDVTVEPSVSALEGFYRTTGGFSALGVDVAAGDDSGRVDPSTVVGMGTRLYDTTVASWTDTAGTAPLHGSVRVESGGPDIAADIETGRAFPTGTYRYVYVARTGNETSSDTEQVEITTAEDTPTPTPAPTLTPTGTPGADGGDRDNGGSSGGGGVPIGGGNDGEVEVEAANLLNGTVVTGQEAVVRVDLHNPDPAGGFLTLKLRADGTTLAEERVRVPASSRRTVFLRATFDASGSYDFTLNDRSLETLLVTAPTESSISMPGSTPTTTPDVGMAPSSESLSSGEATVSPEPAGQEALGTPASGLSSPTDTETIVALGLTFMLLYGVGVAVYVLRKRPSL